MTLEVRVERARCIGSKCCTHAAPGVFALDGQGVATVVDPAADPPEAVRMAAEECPTGAITVTETGGGG
ncbi:MAG TPA: ferredoxin [Acidimicrobiales bacterium]|nr:ferredoxin [Acidimicrobiales bacterium]